MDQTTKETIRKAAQLIKEGSGEAAAPLLAEVLKKEPELEQVWYLLGLAVEDESRKIRAFKQVLRLNPNHEKAKNKLEELEPPPPPPPPPEEPFQTTEAEDPFKIEDFELPDWMQQDSFDPADYSTGSLKLPSEPIFEDEGEDEKEDIPTWAREEPQEFTDLGEDIDLDMSQWDEPERDFAFEQDDEPAPISWEYEPVEEDQFPSSEPEDALAGFLEEPEEDEEAYDRVSAFLAEEDAEEIYEEQPSDEPDWLREIVDDKEDEKAKKKISRITLTPDQKRQRRRRVLNVVLILAIVALGYVGYTIREEWLPYVEPYIPPIMTRAAPITYLLTERAPITYLLTPNFYLSATPTNTPPVQPTVEPTWTPQGGAGAVLPPSGSSGTTDPNITPVSTPTPFPLDEAIINEMVEIQNQVASVRNLPGPVNLDRQLVTLPALSQVLEARILDEDTRAQLQKDEIVLRTFGFINGNYDLATAILNVRVDPIGGYYDFDQDKIYVIGTEFKAQEQYVYAHETAHAIQDVNFGFNRLAIYPTCDKPAQACLAAHALVEGDAKLLETLWFALYPKDVDEEFLDQEPGPLFQESPMPPYFLKHIEFVHEYGYNFVTAAYQDSNWVGVNRLYGFLPTTTEQILHPEKYQRGEIGADLGHPNLQSIFPEGWELTGSGTLGEWDSYLLLAHNDIPDATRPEEEAAQAAAGWGGDEYQVYFNADTGETFLSAYWFWDSEEDANEFNQSLTSYVNTRLFSADADGPGDGMCWYHLEKMSCIYQNGRYLLWLLSDDVELLEQALPRFFRFR